MYVDDDDMYLKINVDFLALNVPWVGFLVTKYSIALKGCCKNIEVPLVVRCNL